MPSVHTQDPGARATEAERMAKLAGSPENVEAVVAFLQKRAPDFARFRTPGGGPAGGGG